VSELAVAGMPWPAIAETVQLHGLRVAAQMFSVSHEAIRQGQLAQGIATNLSSRHEERDRRVREFAAQGVPWAKITKDVGLSTWRVRSLCADLPSRRDATAIT
jgi:hypothetical protein